MSKSSAKVLHIGWFGLLFQIYFNEVWIISLWEYKISDFLRMPVQKDGCCRSYTYITTAVDNWLTTFLKKTEFFLYFSIIVTETRFLSSGNGLFNPILSMVCCPVCGVDHDCRCIGCQIAQAVGWCFNCVSLSHQHDLCTVYIFKTWITCTWCCGT